MTTEYKAFSITKEQQIKALAWMAKHDKAHMKPGQKFRRAGAVGGAYTWCFTPTSIGDCVVVKCVCGKQIDITDYESW